jgi:adenosine kinase
VWLTLSAVVLALSDVQWMLGQPGATAYIGCIGKDEYGKILRTEAESDGHVPPRHHSTALHGSWSSLLTCLCFCRSFATCSVTVHYLEDETTPTGTCAVLITDKDRYNLFISLMALSTEPSDYLTL